MHKSAIEMLRAIDDIECLPLTVAHPKHPLRANEDDSESVRENRLMNYNHLQKLGCIQVNSDGDILITPIGQQYLEKDAYEKDVYSTSRKTLALSIVNTIGVILTALATIRLAMQ